MTDNEKPTALARHLIYQSRWVNLYVDKVQFPNGSIIEQHHLVDFDHTAVMALVQNEQGDYLMVQVCRYPTGRTQWEFPAGRVELGEDLIAATRRELLEESGYQSHDHALIYTYHPMNGISNQVFHIVRCKVSATTGIQDTNEISGVLWVCAAELWDMIRAGELQDGYTLTAFLLNQHI